MVFMWQKNIPSKLCCTFLLMFFFIIQPSFSGAEKLKYIVLLETMDVKEVVDRTYWFQVKMEELGYNQGINMDLVVLKAEGSYQLAESILRTAIAKKKPDLVVTNATLASQTAAKVLDGTNIPQLFFTVSDPVGAGLVKKIGAPTGTNITGRVHSVDREIKVNLVLRLIKDNIKTRPIRFGYIHSTYPSSMGDLQHLQKIAQNNKEIVFVPYEIPYKEFPQNLDYMLGKLSKGLKELDGKIDFLWEPIGPFAESLEYDKLIKEEANVPIVYGANKTSSQFGALISLAPDAESDGKEVALLANRILRGENPGDIPVIPPISFNLGINMTTAQKLNIIIPPDILKLAKGNHFH